MNPKNLTLTITSCDAEIKFSELSIIRKQISINCARRETELVSVLSMGKDITKSLSYIEAIKEHAAKKCIKISIIEVCQAFD